ncbi:MAG: acyl-CoA dehydrogenase N-terminal domain-containing protein, partial [Methylocystis sp.]
MPHYKPPVDEAVFLLNDVFGLKALQSLPGFAE